MMKTNRLKRLLTTLSLAAVVTTAAQTSLVAQAGKVDTALKVYKPTTSLSGNLNSIGSDTLNNLMTLWAESFKEMYPNVKIQIEGKGSSTAPPALIEGTAQLGPMSRQMKGTEIDAFEKKFGYKPTEIKVSIDALAVYTHKDNPLKALSLVEVDGIFSSTRKSGSQDITKWAQAGVQGGLSGRPISVYGRNSASGTYGFFKGAALQGGDFRSTVKEQPGSSSVVQGIASDLAGIGYSGIGYKTSGVNAVAIAKNSKSKPAEPTAENCISGKYPLARFLYVYVNSKPGAEGDLLTREFLKFVLSKQGQEIVVKDGYFPLPAKAAEGEESKVSK